MGNVCCHDCSSGEPIFVLNSSQKPMIPDESEQTPRIQRGDSCAPSPKKQSATQTSGMKTEVAGLAETVEEITPQEESLTCTDLHTNAFAGNAYDLEGDYCAFASAKTFDGDPGLFYLRASSPTSFCLTSSVVNWSYTLSDGMVVSERGNRFEVQGSSILSQGNRGMCFRRAVDIPLARISPASHLQATNSSSSSNQYLITEAGELYKLLKEGLIRLVRGNFLEELWQSSEQWPMLQEIPSTGLWPPHEAAERWATFGPAFFLALSYAWLDPSGADPTFFHSERLVKFLRQFRAVAHILMVYYKLSGHASPSVELPPSDVGVFIDRCSLPQQDRARNILRTPQQERAFMQGLRQMHVIYGHKDITVIRLAAVPSSVLRTYHLRGWTAFETVVSNAKPSAAWKVFVFDEGFDHWNEKGLALLMRSMANQGPPCSPERFKKQLDARKAEVDKLPYPHNFLFSNPEDQPGVVADYMKVWEDQCKTESMSYKNCQWSDDQRESFLEAVPSFSHLKAIELQGIQLNTEEFGLLLGLLPHSMEEILIHKTALSESAGKLAAVQLPRLRNLRRCSLTYHDFGRSMADIFRALGPSVEYLNLNGVSIGDPEVDVLVAVLPSLAKLEYISLGQNKITNASVDILCKAIRDAVSLKRLQLSTNQFDSKGKETLRDAWQQAGRDAGELRI